MIIYKATNKINGKVYVGQTIQGLNDRKYSHKRHSFKKNSPAHFHRAIRKYSFKSFKWEIIDKAKDRKELNNKERIWIKYYDSFNKENGYNSTYGGDSIEFRDYIKKKISLTLKGRKITKAQSGARSIRMSGYGNHFFGRKHSEETKKRISESRKGKGLGQTELQKSKCPHRGSDNRRAVINKKIAKQIKIMISKDIKTRNIHNELSVSINIIKGIRYNNTWKHIKI